MKIEASKGDGKCLFVQRRGGKTERKEDALGNKDFSTASLSGIYIDRQAIVGRRRYYIIQQASARLML
jgi:hypothetical protein